MRRSEEADPAEFSAEDFLEPDNFRTDFDTPESDAEQYRLGRRIGARSTEIHVGTRNVWSARGWDGSSTAAYERIGYHRSTAALLRGFLDSPAAVVVHRVGRRGVVVKERSA